ncbi:MAG: FAD/NAD(P)-binding oxidoreductase [Pseudolabrys sp.]
MPNGKHHRVLIVGGGTAGITVAAILRRHARDLDIAVVEPEQEHYYQPSLTLVGAGVYPLAKTHRPEASLIPPGVIWIRGAAKSFEPEKNLVRLHNGDAHTYEYLVVCTGVRLDWDKVIGLAETLGTNGVCSNYSPTSVNYTWECVQKLKPGDKIICTQPPLPFKCPGAPQKIAYLIADRLRRRGILKQCSIGFFTHAPTIFGVPYFARALVKVAARYGINVNYQQQLVAVNGNAKTATFEFVGDNRKSEKESVPFDLLHVTPPQSPHEEIKKSPLANAAGWVEVNQNTLQHVRFANVYSLGDVCSTPNSKTAAAVRKQAPVVANEIITAVAGKLVPGAYDGYASCPLTTAIGKVILAEFCYGGKVTPTLPLNPSKERWFGWWIKLTGLPLMYWHYMLKGYVWFPKHNTNFKEDAA